MRLIFESARAAAAVNRRPGLLKKGHGPKCKLRISHSTMADNNRTTKPDDTAAAAVTFKSFAGISFILLAAACVFYTLGFAGTSWGVDGKGSPTDVAIAEAEKAAAEAAAEAAKKLAQGQHGLDLSNYGEPSGHNIDYGADEQLEIGLWRTCKSTEMSMEALKGNQ